MCLETATAAHNSGGQNVNKVETPEQLLQSTLAENKLPKSPASIINDNFSFGFETRKVQNNFDVGAIRTPADTNSYSFSFDGDNTANFSALDNSQNLDLEKNKKHNALFGLDESYVSSILSDNDDREWSYESNNNK